MDKSCWMSRLDEDMPLNNVTVPGSHNAGSWDIHACSPWNSARKGTAAKFAKLAKYTLPCINVNYAKVQNLDLVDQFKEGVRYFDLRVAKHDDDYRFSHGLLGSKFLDGIQDLLDHTSFYKYNKEILVLDIRFIWGFRENDHYKFQERLLHMIGNRIASRKKFSPSSSLSKYWNSQKNVIVIYNSKMRSKLFWSKRNIKSTWPNALDPTIAVDKINKFIHDIKDDKYFYGVHAILTPTVKYVATRPFSSTIKLSESINKKVIDLMDNEWAKKVSFIIYDVVEYPGLAEAIILSNF